MAVKYRKISPRIWSDAKFLSVSDDAKLLFLFVLTHPHMTSVGAMRGSVPGLSSEIGWDTQRASKGFAELFAKGLLNHDERASVMVAPNFIKHNPPENPNVVKAWHTAFDELPECELITSHYQIVKGFLEGLPEGFRKPFGKGLANQEQEQEQKDIAQKKRKMPADFSITERVYRWAQEHRVMNIEQHFEHFVSACRAHGYKYADWDAAFMTAVRKDWAKIGDGQKKVALG